MACREYKDTLSAYLDDELKPLTRLRVEAHLRGCGRCRRTLRQTKRASEMVRGLDRVEAPVFAVRRARSIALGERARGWERLRGGLTPRPQQLPLKPVLLAGLAFVMVLVISRSFDTFVAPDTGPEAQPPVAAGEPAPLEGLPGTLSADQLSDAQKAEIARRYLEAHPEGEPSDAPLQEAPGGTETAGTDLRMAQQQAPAPGGEEAMPDALPQAVEADAVLADAAPASSRPPRNETDSELPAPAQPAGELPRAETRVADARPVPGALTLAPTAGGTQTSPTRPADVQPTAEATPGPATGTGPDLEAVPLEGFELGETLRQVLVLAQRQDGDLSAAFHGSDLDVLQRFDDAGTDALEAEEMRRRVVEEVPAPQADLETGIVPPVPVFRAAPELRARARRQRELDLVGPALLHVAVLPDGTVGSLALISSSRLDWLDRAVLRAVEAWQFRPAERDGEPVPVVVELLVEFELE
jgi:TonB family protein